MARELKEEIKQKKPFKSIHEEAELNLVRTTNVLADSFGQLFKQYGITPTQYNVLRILRGSEPEGLCRNEVSQRLLNRMPDATRLLDRMEQAGLVTRARSTGDRRLVTTQITRRGRELVDSLDDVVEQEHRKQLGHLSEQQLRTLIDLLTAVRNRT